MLHNFSPHVVFFYCCLSIRIAMGTCASKTGTTNTTSMADTAKKQSEPGLSKGAAPPAAAVHIPSNNGSQTKGTQPPGGTLSRMDEIVLSDTFTPLKVEDAVDITDILECSANILMVGSNEGGKSTILKQLRMGTAPYTKEEVNIYRTLIRANAYEYMYNVIMYILDFSNISSGQKQPPAERILKAYTNLRKYLEVNDPLILSQNESKGEDDPQRKNLHTANVVGQTSQDILEANQKANHFLKVWKIMNLIWNSEERKNLWNKKPELLHQRIQRARMSSIYPVRSTQGRRCMDDILRLADPQFCPSDADILYAHVSSREPVVSTVESHLDQGLVHVTCLSNDDIGEHLQALIQHQKKQQRLAPRSSTKARRSSTANILNDVDIVVYVTSLCLYDQYLPDGTNRMVDSLQYFRRICNQEVFSNMPVAIIFTHADLFREQLRFSKLQDQAPFCDFTCSKKDDPDTKGDSDSAIEFLEREFRSCVANDVNDPFVFVMNATKKREVRAAISEISAMGSVMSNFMSVF